MPADPATLFDLGAAVRQGRGGFVNLPARPRPCCLVLLAADSREGLLGELRSLRERLGDGGAIDLPAPPTGGAIDLLAPPAGGAHRLALLASGAAELGAAAATAEARLADGKARRLALKGSVFYAAGSSPAAGKTAFLFPGQGSQHPGMLDELCLLFAGVRGWFEELDQLVSDLPIPPPSLLAFPPAEAPAPERERLARELFGLRGGAQLGVVANLSLFDLVTDLGVRCDMMLGHSNGEHAALFASSTFRAGRPGLQMAMRRMIEQALVMPPPPVPEGVLTVGLRDRAALDRLLAEEAGGLHLAMVNCPSQVVLAGRSDAVDRAVRRLSASGAIAARVPLDRAYHTPLFADWGRWLHRLYQDAEAGPGAVPLYSCMTGSLYPEKPDEIRDLAAEQWTRPVDFERTLQRLYEDGARLFVEVGPDSKLRSFVADVLRHRPHLAVASSSARHPAVEQLQRLAGELWVNGVEIDFSSATWGALAAWSRASWQGWQGNGQAAPAAAPETEPAEAEAEARIGIARAHFALMQEFLAGQARILGLVAEQVQAVGPAAPPGDQAAGLGTLPAREWPLLDRVRTDGRRLEAQRRFDLDRDPLLQDHSLGPQPPPPSPGCAPGPPSLAVLPFTFSLEILAEAALALFDSQFKERGAVAAMRGVRGSRWLALDRGTLDIAVTAEILDPARPTARVRIFQVEHGRHLLAFEGDVEVAGDVKAAQAAGAPPFGAAGGAPLAPPRRWSAADFYRDFAFHGPAFHVLCRVHGGAGEMIAADLTVPARPAPRGAAAPPRLLLDPALLDGSGQLVGLWLLEEGHRDFGIFPFHLRELRVFQPAPPVGAAIAGRATVRWSPVGATSAEIDFDDSEGRPLYRLAGLEQRYLAIPPRFARALMGRAARPRWLTDPDPVDERARTLSGLPHRFLEESWGIWSRALAHQVLAGEELDDWYERRGRSIPWLLARAAGKETVRAWAATAQGLELAAADLVLAGEESGQLEVSCPPLAARGARPVLELAWQGENVTARLVAI